MKVASKGMREPGTPRRGVAAVAARAAGTMPTCHAAYSDGGGSRQRQLRRHTRAIYGARYIPQAAARKQRTVRLLRARRAHQTNQAAVIVVERRPECAAKRL